MTHANFYLMRIALVASIGGLLFGYDTAIISGTNDFVRAQFGLDYYWLGWYVSSALVGCIIGVLVAAAISDRFGSRPVLLLSAVLFTASGFGCALAYGFTDLLAWRLSGGIAIGIASVISPMYIAEVAPARMRGALVANYQFAITIGIVAAYFVNYGLLMLVRANWTSHSSGTVHLIFGSEPWRGMLGTEAVPALLFLILLLGIPQSPRWLVANNRHLEAHAVLLRSRPVDEAEDELKEIKASQSERTVRVSTLFKSGFLRATLIGIALAVFSQVSGINAVIYYGPQILQQTGLGRDSAFLAQVLLGMTNCLATIIAILTVDKMGRRPLLVVGITGLLISLVALGFLMHGGTADPRLIVGLIMAYLVCFSFSYGPVVWILLSEFYPTAVRGTAMSVAVVALWSATFFTGFVTPLLLSQPPGFIFYFFAICTLPALYIAIWLVPETKGKTLEQIEAHWASFGKVA